MSNNVFFTSDEHYGHANIIKFCNRPFSGLGDMKEKLIENHNSVVKNGDLVYHLGDMFWRTTPIKEALDIRYRLNGNHYYIMGNHDELFRNQVLRESFVWVKDAENIHPQGFPNVYLHHYACRVWNGSHRGAYHLYGHSHSALPEANPSGTMDESPLCFDVGVDAQSFFPISIEDVKNKMDAKQAKWKPKKFEKVWDKGAE
jgi:calcineurin-like phosphoesterase family protein